MLKYNNLVQWPEIVVLRQFVEFNVGEELKLPYMLIRLDQGLLILPCEPSRLRH